MDLEQRDIKYMFSNSDLRKLILPLVVEQLLLIAVGLVDSIMIASVGEAAVSAVSLVDSIVVLITQIFVALGTGGAVVAGQYLGQKNEKKSCEAADQLILFITVSSIVVMAVCYGLKYFILHKVFGHLEPDVMSNANTYLMIVFSSIPFIGIYNGAAALFRAMGNSKITMKISIFMNTVNFVGNALLIYGLKIGIAGAAIPTTLSRVLAAVIAVYLIRNSELQIHLSDKICTRFNKDMIKRILYIGIPNSLENGMFQFGKLIVLNLVASFGTASIAANAVGNAIGIFQVAPGMAIVQANLAVISQCVGANDEYQTRYYTKKMTLIAYASIIVTSVIILLSMGKILELYNLSDQTAAMARQILVFTCIWGIITWPFSFLIPSTLRASNDVKFCMYVAVLSMWIFRVGFSYVIGKYMGLGLFGVWIAMVIDWIVRGIFFESRYLSGKWKMHWY